MIKGQKGKRAKGQMGKQAMVQTGKRAKGQEGKRAKGQVRNINHRGKLGKALLSEIRRL